MLFSFNAGAQFYNPDESIKDEPWNSPKRFYTGGGLGLNFGQTTFINISPDLGYRITDRYSAGIGFSYIRYRDRFYDLTMYGGKLFNRLDLFKFLFAHAEYALLNGPFGIYGRRTWLNNIWAGGGISQGVGKTRIFLMALWNLGPDQSIFSSPQISGGIGIGL